MIRRSRFLLLGALLLWSGCEAGGLGQPCRASGGPAPVCDEPWTCDRDRCVDPMADCGNGICDRVEHASICPEDCGCGDGYLDRTREVCDVRNPLVETCQSLGFVGGDLRCAWDCTAYDTSDCTQPMCGNGAIEPGEVCEIGDVGGLTCALLGFDAGSLVCNPDCTEYDAAACRYYECGNGVIDPGETCDGSDTGGETCISRGFGSGSLGCSADCSGFDLGGCS